MEKLRIPDYADEYLLFGLLFMTNNRLQAIGDQFFEEITVKQWFAIAMLETFETEDPTLNALAELMGSSHQNVKQIVLKLQEKGYVELYTDLFDKRKMRIRTTALCKDLGRNYQEKIVHFMETLFQNVEADELKHAVKVLIQLQENCRGMK